MTNATTALKPKPTPDEIWAGDLFGRKEEAELLVDYIESVGRRPIPREDHRGFTISVDAEYGIGKSYFLRRLSAHLELNHPVAFVDAWSDDLADDPMTAIAATLKRALGPLISSTPNVQAKWNVVATKTGEVAKIVGIGLLKKGAGLLITGAAVSAVETVLDGVSDNVAEDIEDAGNTAADGAVDELLKTKAKKLMADKIENFEAGQLAIRELKESLSDLVASLPLDRKGPVVIIIDELDRCRPTYAIKLLEETKHLFDVPGIVFVLGINSDQLSSSVAGAYGAGFDGKGYLRRFINRQYSLSFPDLAPLIEHLVQLNGINKSRLAFPSLAALNDSIEAPNPSILIARYMSSGGLTARDAFSVVDVLQTCAALTKTAPLMMTYLMPLIVSKVRGDRVGSTNPVSDDINLTFAFHDYSQERPTKIGAKVIFDEIRSRSEWGNRELMNSVNNNDAIARELMDLYQSIGPGNNLARPANYIDLLQKVAKFSTEED